MDIEVSVVIGFAGLLLSLMIYAVNKAVKMESRVTSIEKTIEDKLTPIWDVIMKELPRILIKEETPELDEFLRMASNGIDDMTAEQIHTMVFLLEEEYSLAVKTGDSGRAVGIALYKATLKEKNKQ